MQKIIVVVKDNVAETFHDTRNEINVASAIRAFTHSVQESPNKDDYSLYQVGIFDTDSGNIKPNEPIRLYTGHEVKNKVSSITMEQQIEDLEKMEMLKKQSGN